MRETCVQSIVSRFNNTELHLFKWVKSSCLETRFSTTRNNIYVTNLLKINKYIEVISGREAKPTYHH